MLVGAGLGTLPDLDVFIDFGGAVENFTYHRGFSHSLFVLAPFSVLLWLALRRWWAPVREAPYRWLAAISLALLTHPLLDAHTKAMRSKVADWKNSGGRDAGISTAGAFLKGFVGDTPWVHLDIAGSGMTPTQTPLHIGGGTGVGVRMLTEWVARRAK